MANVYVGFHDQRSCNRILKPPGGGTSNIFGGELIPDVVPQNSPRKETKNRGSSIQDVLQTESVTTTVTRREEKSSTTNGTVTVQESNVSTSESNETQTNGNTVRQEFAVIPATASTPDVASELTCKVEQLKIEQRSSKSEVTETDSSGNTNVILSESSSQGSVEQNSNVKKGSSIGEILNQENILEKKRGKGQSHQRVPPGGYSSGLW